MMPNTLGLIFLIVTFPVVLYITFSDLKFLRIPNVANLALLAIFVVIAPFFLEWGDYGIRIGQGVIVLIIGFILTSIGLLGGGDSKLFAVMAPYIAYQDITTFLFLSFGLTIIAIIIDKVVRRIPRFMESLKDWRSFQDKQKLPYGFPLSISLSIYLAIQAVA